MEYITHSASSLTADLTRFSELNPTAAKVKIDNDTRKKTVPDDISNSPRVIVIKLNRFIESPIALTQLF